jgi:hypothetical protein
MTSPISTRLFIEGLDITPDNQVLNFSNATAVGNYYGASSYEYNMARTYFTGPYASSATMEFVRDSNGQRPHLIGANLANIPFSQLQNINGPISLTFDKFTYSGNVNTAGAANLTEVASDVQNALNSNPQIAAGTTGDTITPETIDFTGTLSMSQLYVTSGGPLVVGGVISGPGVINGPNYDAQIIAHRGSPTSEHYSTFSNSGTASGALTETYGILHIGTLVSGQIKAGEELSVPGMPNTAIVQDLGGGNWLVNNAPQAVISGDFTVTAPALTVQSNQLQGVTENHDFLEVSVGGEYGFDQRPSSLGFAENGSTGTAADLLGLSKSSGAMDSSPGGQRVTIAQMMKQFIARAPDPFGSFQSAEPRLDGAFEHWQQHHPSYAFLPNNHKTTTPAGETPFAWNGGSGNWDTASAWNPLGPPAASSSASIGGTTTETIVVESPNDTAATVILDNPNASLDIGGAAGAQLTVANTLAIEQGTLGIDGLGTLDAAHIRIAAPKGSKAPATGVLRFPGGGTISATVENNGTIKAEGAAGSTVAFERAVTGNGAGSADISGGGTLEFAKKVVQNIDFGAAGGTLSLLDPTAFDAHGSGSIADFAAGDTISLAGHWHFHLLTKTSGTTHLTLTSGATTHTFDFIGAYNHFAIASGAKTTIKFA